MGWHTYQQGMDSPMACANPTVGEKDSKLVGAKLVRGKDCQGVGAHTNEDGLC